MASASGGDERAGGGQRSVVLQAMSKREEIFGKTLSTHKKFKNKSQNALRGKLLNRW